MDRAIRLCFAWHGRLQSGDRESYHRSSEALSDGTWRSFAAHLLWEQGVAGSRLISTGPLVLPAWAVADMYPTTLLGLQRGMAQLG
jgi:hypothetical protein